MADLSERLEAAEAALRGFGQYVPVGDPNRAVLASCVATLREVLAHPERLLGEPVAWRYECGSWTHLLSQPSDNYFSIDRGQSFIKGQPLYAPEVKP